MQRYLCRDSGHMYNGTLYTFGPETRLINTAVSAATVIRAGYFMQKFKFIFGTVYVQYMQVIFTP